MQKGGKKNLLKLLFLRVLHFQKFEDRFLVFVFVYVNNNKA